MIEYYIPLIDSDYIKIFLLSMLPIAELRFSIPYGYFVLNLLMIEVIVLSIIGNILVGLLIITIIGPVMQQLRKIHIFSFIIKKIFSRTIHKGKIINSLKILGLILFIGVPLPFTGVWTGSLASYLFGFDKFNSLVAICLGVILSSIIVSTICYFSKELLLTFNIYI